MDDSAVSYTEALKLLSGYYEKARKLLTPACYVCKDCNGTACAGRPFDRMGLGAKGNNGAFLNNCEALRKMKILFDPVHEEFQPDTTATLFGHRFTLPVFASPIGTLLTEKPVDSPFFNTNERYAAALAQGCRRAGALPWFGDNKAPGYFEGQLECLEAIGGAGVPTIKPWADRAQFWRRVELAKRAGAMAIATDLDAVGLAYQQSGGRPALDTRSAGELKELVERAEIPVVVKGLLSVSSAVKAAEAGVYGIVVSNHGGNVAEYAPAPCQVLPGIRKAVGNSLWLFADGGVRCGEDVFKLLALGADAVGIGRPYIQAVYGGGADGAFAYTLKIKYELQSAMRLAGCGSIAQIGRGHLLISDL